MAWYYYGCALLIVVTASIARAAEPLPETCLSPIYCYGDLLRTVQLAHIFNDSKTFVDMRIKGTVNGTLDNFKALMDSTGNNPTKDQIIKFVQDNFEEGKELENWTPTDFNDSPEFLNDVSPADIKQFAKDLVGIWPKLGRIVRSEVETNQDHYSLIYVKNGLVVPGGRFREFYYWDSYWIIKGLLISEMHETAKGIIENLMSMVQRYGFVPNGGRVYYTQRTQPPLLTAMAASYMEYTNNTAWLKQNIQYLDQELRFWLANRTVQVVKPDGRCKNGKVIYKLAHYSAKSAGPRPESYREDYLTAAGENEMDMQEKYIELKSAAESGWDFSSRWFFDPDGGTNTNLTGIQTRRVAPADLNAFLCGAFKDLSRMYKMLGMTPQSDFWQTEVVNWQNSLKELLWNEEDGIWYDLDLELNDQRKYFSASNVAPLWTQCFDVSHAKTYGGRVAQYLKANGISNFPGGIPTTLDQSGEQWDLPNCWPPLQAIVVQGLDQSGDEEAVELARALGEQWVIANHIGYNQTGDMFEKYDAYTPGGYGGGGEYVVQSGFGWTNGVVLEFVDRYFRGRS